MRSEQSLQEYESRVQSGETALSGIQPIVSVESRYFIFEVIVRQDKVVVIHLRNLRHDFRNKRMMDYLAKYVRDKVGGYKSFYADFTGELAGMNGKQEINSLDIFITEYAPAMMHDAQFVHRHLTQVGQKLIEHLNTEL